MTLGVLNYSTSLYYYGLDENQFEVPSPRGMVLEGRPFGTRLGLTEVIKGSVSLVEEKETFALCTT